MARPIIHIGYHKTGTSWFQTEFYPNVQNARYVPRESVRRALVRPRGLDFDPSVSRSEILSQFQAGERLIVCEEGLSGNIHIGGSHGFAAEIYGRRIKAVFPNARIVLFFRPLIEHVASIYRQYIRVGGTKSPRAYLQGWDFHPRNPSFSLEHLNFRKYVSFYSDLFGPDDVYLYNFDDFARDPEDFTKGYGADVGIEFDASDINWHKRVNRGYGVRCIWIARLINLFTASDILDKYYLFDLPGLYKRSRPWLRRLNEIPVFRGSTSADDVLGSDVVERLEEFRESRELF